MHKCKVTSFRSIHALTITHKAPKHFYLFIRFVEPRLNSKHETIRVPGLGPYLKKTFAWHMLDRPSREKLKIDCVQKFLKLFAVGVPWENFYLAVKEGRSKLQFIINFPCMNEEYRSDMQKEVLVKVKFLYCTLGYTHVHLLVRYKCL